MTPLDKEASESTNRKKEDAPNCVKKLAELISVLDGPPGFATDLEQLIEEAKDVAYHMGVFKGKSGQDPAIKLYTKDDVEQLMAKAELEGRQHESVYVRQCLNFDVNNPANKRYVSQRWHDLTGRIKRLKEN